MECIYKRPESLLPVTNQFCPGCMHSTAFKIIGEVFDEMNIREKVALVLPVGCAISAEGFMNCDLMWSFAHGRAPAVATGFKRIRTEQPVLVYQGDGDASSIGLCESFYAANRGEAITVVMINNQIYGMTGGQMSPTTLLSQKSTTTMNGRISQDSGYPTRLAEIIGSLEAPRYVARHSLHTPKHILAAKNAIKKGLEIQINEKGYSFIEILAACPTNWGISPDKTPEYMEKEVIPYFPLGEIKSV